VSYDLTIGTKISDLDWQRNDCRRELSLRYLSLLLFLVKSICTLCPSTFLFTQKP